MVTRSVTCIGDVTAAAGNVIPSENGSPIADNGGWTAGPVTPTSYKQLTVNGAEVVYQAQCIFSFAGTKSNSPVKASSTVTLKAAAATILQGGLSNLLRDGDSVKDMYGNTVKATGTRLLASG
jgi:hypothetical protein